MAEKSRGGRRKRPATALLSIDNHGVTLAVFAVAIFLSAGLLFSMQPLFTKMVLPTLGGAPSVWSVALVFFQAALLGGYLYAHLLTRHLPGRQSVVLHLLVMLAATLALPLGMAAGWGRPPAEGEFLWLLGLFAVSIGLPFFALSANGPLLQAWYARTGHPSAKDPYFLYAASNIGSFLALLSYPFLVEPFSRVSEQAEFWSGLFYVLIVLIACCGVLLVRSKDAAPSAVPVGTGALAAPNHWDAAIWAALAAVPAGLMIAVTAHISTDIAAAPLLWVIPLALYLLSFVLVFQTKPVVPLRYFVAVQPFLIAALVATFAVSLNLNILALFAIHIATFFVTAVVCHGELAKRRPPARYLTSFYLWMAVGGVVGGLVTAMVAPGLFNWVAEYPLLIIAAVLCRPGFAMPDDRENRIFWAAALAVLVLLAIPHVAFGYEFAHDSYGGVVLVLLAVALVLSPDPLKFAAVIALAFVFIRIYDTEAVGRTSIRSFFGVHKILDTPGGEYRVLMHGTTIHGAQRVRDAEGNPIRSRPEPITYYTTNSGIGQSIAAVRENKGEPIRIAAIGLGTGSVACLTEPGDALTFYEIDRTVVRISRDDNYFTFIANCAPDASVILGDARLTLADAPDGAYDIIIVDAFTSDAIPVHLLTHEAMEVYLRKLVPDGLVVLHVSNRHLELSSVVAGVAAASGAITRVHTGGAGDNDEDDYSDTAYRYSTNVAVVGRDDEAFGALATRGSWEVKEPDPKQWIWTDDYSNLIGALMRNLR
ncbi:MAG: fused MFS/spermidine synthase [Bradyrhizobiaceae bacterium]|nr:fused MFS/spermidine synthase [Bradyrhizobiaceae bacterium]